MDNIDGFTILSGALIVLSVAFLTTGVVYLGINIVAHAIIVIRKAKRHPMGYYTGGARRQVRQPEVDLNRFEFRDPVKTK